MPAATSLIIAGASAAASAGQAIAANKRRKEADFAAKDAASRLKGISETDFSAGLQVPTMGYDLAQQGIQQQAATGVQALQEAGAAGVIGGMPNLQQQANEANLQLGADLQQQEYQRDLFRAQNQQAIDQRRVAREADIASQEVAGAQMAASENRQIVNDAISGGLGALQLGYSQYLQAKPLYDAKKTGLPSVTIQQAKSPFQASSSILQKTAETIVPTTQYGPMMNPALAPAGTGQYSNASYAPGYTPYGVFPGLVTPFKR
jgi:hypothetical protein